MVTGYINLFINNKWTCTFFEIFKTLSPSRNYVRCTYLLFGTPPLHGTHSAVESSVFQIVRELFGHWLLQVIASFGTVGHGDKSAKQEIGHETLQGENDDHDEDRGTLATSNCSECIRVSRFCCTEERGNDDGFWRGVIRGDPATT